MTHGRPISRKGAWAAVLGCLASWVGAEVDALRVPDGFHVAEFAGDDLAHDAFSLTFDADGRAVVSGPGYIRRLEDVDGDGRAEGATTLFAGPQSGAQGLCFVGSDLFFTGDGGLWRLAGAEGDARFEQPPTRWAELANSEHGAHQLVQGPDGWLYLVCGNEAGVASRHVHGASSPVRDPQCGALLRFSTDGRQTEIVAHGFRNPYDLAFAADGRLFTVDSDGERDQYLPWYAPTRVYDVVAGAHHGWVNGGWTRSWSRPPGWFDSAPRFADLGRGSPTGAAIYRHRAFPPRFRDGLFTACWTLGRVYFVPLADQPPATPEIFLESLGDSGLAPVDLEVGPEGDLWLAIGGRGTRGGVYRITAHPPPERPLPADQLAAVLEAPQPLSAWSRAQWQPAARALGEQALLDAARDAALAPPQRRRAIEILTEMWNGLDEPTARELAACEASDLAACAAWSLGRTAPADWKGELLLRLVAHPSTRAKRAAYESLARLPDRGEPTEPGRWRPGLAAEDRDVRQAALAAAGRSNVDLSEIGDSVETRLRIAEVESLRGATVASERCLSLARELWPDRSPELQLEATRLLQRAHGDAWTGAAGPQEHEDLRVAGYSPARRATACVELEDWLCERFPSGDFAVDQELSRLAGIVGLDRRAFVDKLTEQWTATSSPEADLHYLFVLAELPGPWSDAAVARTAAALAGLHDKMHQRGWHPSRNWPQHVAQLVVRLAQRDARFPAALASEPALRWPEQAAYCEALTGEARRALARRMLPSVTSAERPATAEVWALLGALPLEETRPALEAQAERYGVTAPMLKQLAAEPRPADRQRLLQGLRALDAETVALSARGLIAMPSAADDSELADAMAAIRLCAPDPAQRIDGAARENSALRPARQALSELLARWSGRAEIHAACAAADFAPAACRAWLDWYAETPQGRRAAAGAPAVAWTARAAAIAGTEGDARRGRKIFEQQACIRCHEGDARLGPDLRGVAQRLARQDLLVAIVDPHRDVSPTYRLRHYETIDGRVYQGLVIYESPEATLVQIDPDRSVRLRAEEIALEGASPRSLMPEGLLDRLPDRDVADLLAYLDTLRGNETQGSGGVRD